MISGDALAAADFGEIWTTAQHHRSVCPRGLYGRERAHGGNMIVAKSSRPECKLMPSQGCLKAPPGSFCRPLAVVQFCPVYPASLSFLRLDGDVHDDERQRNSSVQGHVT
jgi:hypothetical protein